MSVSTMKKEIAKAILSVGTPVLKNESVYGWKDIEAKYHIMGLNRKTYKFEDALKCEWMLPEVIEIEEVYVSEFMDTFTDNNDAVMVQLNSAHCACGAYEDSKLRYEGTFGEFLAVLLKD